MMELANGKEPDGIAYRVYLEPPNWIAEVTAPDGTKLIESWHWAYPPKAGADVADYAHTEEALERLIVKMRGNMTPDQAAPTVQEPPK